MLPRPGDGGAPVLDVGGEVAGLASYTSAVGPGTCGDVAGYVHVPRFADWIANTIPTLPVPTEVLEPEGEGGGGADPTTGSGGEGGAVGGGGSSPGSGGGGGGGEAGEPLELDGDSDCACRAPGAPLRSRSGWLAIALAGLAVIRRRKPGRRR